MIKWLKASRPHTMGLSFAVIIAGSFLVGYKALRIDIFLLALLSAAGFQLVSNFANDYGDFKKGTDKHRDENYRALSAGNLTTQQVRNAIIVLSLLSLICVVSLVWRSPVPATGKWTMFGLGIASIVAAITYTLGKRPYGYYAAGDMMVFIFFGIVGVVGSYYLQGGSLEKIQIWLVAGALGSLSTSVLNINNMRDSETDKQSGKITIANVLGQRAIIYQYGLSTLAVLGFAGWSWINPYAAIVLLLTVLLCLRVIGQLTHSKTHGDYNQCLAMTVQSTVVIACVTGVVGLFN